MSAPLIVLEPDLANLSNIYSPLWETVGTAVKETCTVKEVIGIITIRIARKSPRQAT